MGFAVDAELGGLLLEQANEIVDVGLCIGTLLPAVHRTDVEIVDRQLRRARVFHFVFLLQQLQLLDFVFDIFAEIGDAVADDVFGILLFAEHDVEPDELLANRRSHPRTAVHALPPRERAVAVLQAGQFLQIVLKTMVDH